MIFVETLAFVFTNSTSSLYSSITCISFFLVSSDFGPVAPAVREIPCCEIVLMNVTGLILLDLRWPFL